jgi:hypothetical protein
VSELSTRNKELESEIMAMKGMEIKEEEEQQGMEGMFNTTDDNNDFTAME